MQKRITDESSRTGLHLDATGTTGAKGIQAEDEKDRFQGERVTGGVAD